MLAYLLAQKFGVHARAKRQERRTEAGGEGANGVGNAAFRARNFARVARNEIVHCLLVGKFANGRQHAVSVGGKEDNGVGVSAHAGYNGVGYKVYGVSHAGVFGKRFIGEIGNAGSFVNHHVFHNRAVADSSEYFGLFLGGKVYALGVATALYIEYAVVAPAVLVVAYKSAVGVCRKRGFTRARKAEEQRGVAAAVLRHVGRAVHAQHAFFGQKVVHHAEHRFFHFAAVLATRNNHQFFGKRHQNGGLAVNALFLGV